MILDFFQVKKQKLRHSLLLELPVISKSIGISLQQNKEKKMLYETF